MKLEDRIELEQEEIMSNENIYQPKSPTVGIPIEVTEGPQAVAPAPRKSNDDTVASALDLYAGVAGESLRARLPEDAATIESQLSAMKNAVVTLFDDPVRIAAASPDLTEIGFSNTRREAATKLLENLAPFERLADENEAGVEKFAEELLAAGTLAPTANSAAILAEIRAVSDPLKRSVAYQKAVDAGDLEVVAAIENSPKIYNDRTMAFEDTVPPELVRENRLARGRETKPETAEKSDRLRALASAYRGALSAVRGAVVLRVPELDDRQPE